MYVIFIHGPAAAGKHTIGSLLSERLNVPLFHNHLTVDLVKTLFEFGSPSFIELREEIWERSFATAARTNQSFVFTFHPESTVQADLIARLQRIIQDGGGQIVFVELLCSEKTILQRLNNQSRAKFGKLRDRVVYEEIKNSGGFDYPSLPEATVTIDTAATEPEDAVRAIYTVLEGVIGDDLK